MGTFIPSIDIREGEKEILVKAELPGVEDSDVEVFLSNDALTLKGEKKEEKEAEASFKHGVLTIRLPRKEEVEERGKKIPIKAE